MIIVGVHVDDAKFIAQTDYLKNEFVEKFNYCDEFLKTRIIQDEDFVSFDQTAKILNYCEEFQITKPQKSFDMDINDIMKDQENLKTRRDISPLLVDCYTWLVHIGMIFQPRLDN